MIEYPCGCVDRHIPKPVTTTPCNTPEGVVWLCPTSAENLRVLLEIYDKRAGIVPGSMTKHFSKYVRDLAEQIYNER